MGIEFMTAPEDVVVLFDEFEPEKEYEFHVKNWTGSKTVAHQNNSNQYIQIDSVASNDYPELRIRKGSQLKISFPIGSFKREWSRQRIYLDLTKIYYGKFRFKAVKCGKGDARKLVFIEVETKEI